MVYDYYSRLVESGYCRYTSFVLIQDIDANTFVIKNTIIFGANIVLTEKQNSSKYICFYITIFVEIVCIMRRQESETRTAVTMSLVSIPFAKGGPQIKTHLAQ